MIGDHDQANSISGSEDKQEGGLPFSWLVFKFGVLSATIIRQITERYIMSMKQKVAVAGVATTSGTEPARTSYRLSISHFGDPHALEKTCTLEIHHAFSS